MPIRLHSSRIASASIVFLAVLFLTPHASAQQKPAPTPQPSPTPAATVLGKVEFVGLTRTTQEQARTASGLQLGQPADVDAVEQAANRLVETGLFKKLSYSYRSAKGQATVVFTVEEMTARAPVVFDNFVWFSDREIDEYLRRTVTGYDGTAPEAGGGAAVIARALEGLLQARGVEGSVEHMPSADPSGRNPEHVFTVKGPRMMRVCALHFPGASAVREEVLVQTSGGIFNNEYSRQFIRGFVESNLTPLYRERGRLRAAFHTPQARPETTDECSGVVATVAVDEGAAYVWERAEWSGNAALAAEELDKALGMKAKELANGAKIDKGLEAVRKAYGRKGYLTPSLAAAPAFDDAARSVTYRVAVNEGPQYQMGDLVIEGLSEKDTNNLKTRWTLMPREVYDEGYLKTFMEKTVAEFLRDPSTDARAQAPLKTETTVHLDREQHRVDVTLTFKPLAAKN